jgi:hypothetical protein
VLFLSATHTGPQVTTLVTLTLQSLQEALTRSHGQRQRAHQTGQGRPETTSQSIVAAHNNVLGKGAVIEVRHVTPRMHAEHEFFAIEIEVAVSS